jgi:hypothetical protein
MVGMATERVVHNLTLVPVEFGTRMVIYRRRPANSTLDERVRAMVVAYRTFVADGQIYTDVLVEDNAGVQEFIPLAQVIFMKRASDIWPPASAASRGASAVPASGF